MVKLISQKFCCDLTCVLTYTHWSLSGVSSYLALVVRWTPAQPCLRLQLLCTDFGSIAALSFSCNVGRLLISWKSGSRFQVSRHITGDSRQLSLDWRLEHVSNNGTSSNLDYRGEYQSILPRGPYDRWRLYKQIRTPLSIGILALLSSDTQLSDV